MSIFKNPFQGKRSTYVDVLPLHYNLRNSASHKDPNYVRLTMLHNIVEIRQHFIKPKLDRNQKYYQFTHVKYCTCRAV